jgi:hypothetical protein
MHIADPAEHNVCGPSGSTSSIGIILPPLLWRWIGGGGLDLPTLRTEDRFRVSTSHFYHNSQSALKL